MRGYLKRVALALATGYVLLYFGEIVFWATPERPGMEAVSLAATWLVYSWFGYVFLGVVGLFRARSVWAVFLAGAVFGWYEEGIVVQTMYGTPDGPFPVSISFTGLAWHALLDVLVGWYLVRRVLVEGRAGRVGAVAAGLGLFYGLWAVWWWIEPPAPMQELLKAGRTDLLFACFAAYAAVTNALLVLAYAVIQRLGPGGFRAGNVEVGAILGLTALYYALVTVPAAPRALWVLPPLMGATLAALWRNRRIETRPDALVGLAGRVPLGRWVLLMLAPLMASAVYGIGLAGGWRLATNVVVYYVSSVLGAALWMASLAAVLLTRVPGEQSSPAASEG